MHSQIALELHYITKSVTLPLNETATYCLRWPLLSVRCDNAMSPRDLGFPTGAWLLDQYCYRHSGLNELPEKIVTCFLNND